MKKAYILAAMLLALALLASACSSPAPVEEEPTATPEPTQAPTIAPVTPEPTVSPRIMEGTVEWPAPDATMIEIDPIDKPTTPPIVFEPYRTYESPNLKIKLDMPAYFDDPTGDIQDTTQIVFQEPATDIRSGAPFRAAVTIAVSRLSSEQTERDAQNYLDVVIGNLRNDYEKMETSSQAENSMMGQKGSYVSYWIDMPVEGGAEGETFRMRGRCVVIPKGTNLYMIRTYFPSTHNYEYDEAVFKKIRSTLEVIE